MRIYIGLCLGFCCFFFSARGTSIVERSLPDIVASSDSIIVAKITRVEMIDRLGNQVSDPRARTGPGSWYTIRFHVEIVKEGLLKTNVVEVPEKLIINNWPGWINSLEQFKPLVGEINIFLLKGPNFQMTYADGAQLPLNRKEEVLRLLKPSEKVIAFYYGWYGNPKTDGAYQHWDSPVFNPNGTPSSKHFPGGEDIASNFYPEAGGYSVNDPKTLDRQMRELKSARVGVIAASWWGEDHITGRLLPLLLEAAAKHGLKVCIHIEPFADRNGATTGSAIKTLIDRFGNHPALFRPPELKNRPLFFIYDSYLTPAKEWANIFSPGGKETIRNSKYDSAVIGLWVKKNDGEFLKDGHFDGFYTYFAAEGFTYGSSTTNWSELAQFAHESKMIFIPSVGPGYIDTRIRPWNGKTTRDRAGGVITGACSMRRSGLNRHFSA
jgi:glycoprotein endo-alpha-1,2-mannosidase